MKKYILPALALALLLTACGGPAAETTVPTPGETTEATPLPTPTETPMVEPTETPVGSLVYTDWSRLEPYEPKRAVYTRRYEGFTDTLIPADDYGPLLSFAGTALTDVEEWDYMGGYRETFYLYGLVTAKGEVVVDPVLSSVIYLTETDRWGSQYSRRPAALLLGKVFYDGGDWPEERFALCALDGSWCTDFLYEYSWENYFEVSFAQGIPMVRQDGRLVFLDLATGEELRWLDLAAQVGTDDFSLSGFGVDPNTGWVTVNLTTWDEEGYGTNHPLLFDPLGNPRPLPAGLQWVDRCGDGLVPAGGDMDKTDGDDSYRFGYVDTETGEWAIPPIYAWCGSFENGVAWVSEGNGGYLMDTAGTALTGTYGDPPDRHGDYWYAVEDFSRIVEVLDRDLKRVESPLVGAVSCHYPEDGWVCGKVGDEWILAQGEEVRRFPDTLGDFWDLREGRMMFYRERGENETAIITLTDLEGNEVVRWDQYTSAYFSWDQVTGESYVSAYNYLTEDYWDDLYDLDGQPLAVGKEYGYLMGGLLYAQDDDAAIMTDREGNVVFCWPIHSGVD